ncbi:ABC transporter permease [Chelativorans alearense]|uniref:ABC transporter permease n=1 Tax=Chelativorans alearense TaxID=2681495 RepID=UPI001FE4A53C|nr:ABC transporter permease [Chelativorans alearense]
MKRAPLKLLSVLGFFLLWAIIAAAVNSPDVPGPAEVGLFVAREASSGELFYNLAVTLSRVAAAFLISLIVGSAIGIVMGQNRAVDRILDPWIIIFVNLPALVIIVLCYIWMGLTEVAAVTAVALNKIPNVVITMREGARSLDPKLSEMARVFRFSRMRTIRHVVLPQLQPFIAAAGRSGLALIWKIVLVVELLGRSNGVGFQIHLYFQLFDVAAILGYTLAFVIVMLAIEFSVVQPLEHHLTRWRPKPA